MIKDNVLLIREKIRLACLRAGRDPASVTFLAVSKNRSLEQIREAFQAGLVDFGENKVQEAGEKYRQLALFGLDTPVISWHMVGHLQGNKAREAVKIFDLIHSVDSLRLAREIDKQAARIDKVQEILLEVKTSPEETKFGLKPEDLPGVLKQILLLRNLSVRGLMTIAPAMADPQAVRPYFRGLRELKEKLDLPAEQAGKFNLLSMGMSDDFEAAIEEGANLIRVGRAVFEERLS